jgi:hypothetical protein
VKTHVGMGFEPGTDLGGGVSRGVVEDHLQGVAVMAAVKEFEEGLLRLASIGITMLAMMT